MGKNKRQKRGFKGKKSPPSSSHKTKKGKNKPHHNDHEHGHGAHSSGGAATGAGGWWKTQLYDELEGDCGITDENQRKTLVHTVSELRKPTVNRYVKQVPVVDRKQVYIPEEPMDRGAMDEDDDDKDGTTSSDFSDEDLAGAYAGIKPIRGLTTSGKKIRDPPKIHLPKDLRLALEDAVDAYFDAKQSNRDPIFQKLAEYTDTDSDEDGEFDIGADSPQDGDEEDDFYADTAFYASLNSVSDGINGSSDDSSTVRSDSPPPRKVRGQETANSEDIANDSEEKSTDEDSVSSEEGEVGRCCAEGIEDSSGTGEKECNLMYPGNKCSDEETSKAFSTLCLSDTYKDYKTLRRMLPIYQMEEQIISAVKENAVTVICGETGCGKTTQVPQIILDSYLKEGKASSCRMAITQPRRIAAISVGERVAQERCSTVRHERQWSVEGFDTEELDRLHEQLPGVGYQVRFDRKIPENAGVMFCTTGILLRWLLSDPDLEGFSHILIDEVHERTLESDLLLITIRDILARRPSLRVIIMSATLDSQRFSDYFRNYKWFKSTLTTLQIPSAGHKVATMFLEDTIQLIDYDHLYNQSGGELCSVTNKYPPAVSSPSRSSHSYTRNWDGEGLVLLYDLMQLTEASTGTSALPTLMKSFGVQENAPLKDRESSISLLKHILTGSITRKLPDFRQSELSNLICLLNEKSLATSEAGISREVRCSFAPYTALSVESALEMELYRKPTVHFGLIIQILESIVSQEGSLLSKVSEHASERLTLEDKSPPEEAGVLIFLPGWSAMRKLQDAIKNHPLLGIEGTVETVLCHGNLHSKAQKAIFTPAAKGCRKVVIATNVAESSITIEKIRYVIDSGLFKQSDFVSLTRDKSLEPAYVSQANAIQRRGRAGRTSWGVCFHLFSAYRFYYQMPAFPKPEILRTPLEGLCLYIKALELDHSYSTVLKVIKKALDPPPSSSVAHALTRLRHLGAIHITSKKSGSNQREMLTGLGRLLALWPLDPELGKSMVLASLLGERTFSSLAVSVLSYKEPFLMAMSGKQLTEVKQEKKHFSRGIRSDLFASIEAVWQWASRFGVEGNTAEEGSHNIAAVASREDEDVVPDEERMTSGLRDDEEAVYSERKVTNSPEAWAFARKHQLSYETCWLLLKYQRQLSHLTRELSPLDDAHSQQYSSKEAWPFVIAALTGGFTSFNRAVFTTMGNKPKKERLCLFTATGEKAAIDPLSGTKGIPDETAKAFPFLLFQHRSKNENGKVLLEGVSPVPPLFPALLGGLLSSSKQERRYRVGYNKKHRLFRVAESSELCGERFYTNPETASILMKARNALEDLVEKYVSNDLNDDELAASNYLVGTVKRVIAWGWTDAYKKVANIDEIKLPGKMADTATPPPQTGGNTSKGSGKITLEDGTNVTLGGSKSKAERKRLARAAQRKNSTSDEDTS